MEHARHPSRLCVLLSIAACMLLGSSNVGARPLSQYAHSAFRERDGVPNEITSIGQTRDGMLWLGAQGGVYTFDGVRFARHPVMYRNIPHKAYFLKGDQVGGLWIGWRYGGISHVQGETIRHFGVEDGIAPGTIWGFAFDQAGGVWAAGVRGVMRYDGKRWRQLGPEQGFTAASAAAVTVDGAGTVGVFTEQGLFLMPRGADRFAPPIGKTATRQPPAYGPRGEIYFIEERGIRRISTLARYEQDDFPWLYREDGVTGSFVADRSGGLWFDSDRGMHRIERPDADRPFSGRFRTDTETRNRSDGLSGNVSYAQFEDAQGNVWISTEGGLDRFRPVTLAEVRPKTEPPVLDNPHLAPAREGGAWVQTFFPRSALQRVLADGSIVERLELDTTVLLPTREGLVYMARDRRLALRSAGRSHPISAPLPPGRLIGLVRQADGTLWASLMPKGVWRHESGGWRRETRLPDDAARAMHAGADGAMWFGFDNEGVLRLAGDSVKRFGPAQGLSVARVAHFAEIGGALWIAGSQGLNILRAGKLAIARPAVPGRFDLLTDLLPDAAGGMWLNGGAGLMYLAPADVATCLKACAQPLATELFDGADGLRGRSSWAGYGQLAFDAEGWLWAATSVGVFRLDPARLPGRAIAPLPRILGSSAPGGAASATLGPDQRDIAIDYTAPVLDVPEQARFRYRLHGYDQDWREAGNRRQAIYTGLPPGRYRFEVAAARDDSGWSAAGATLALTVVPAWHETWWFRTLCAAALLALALLGHRWRLRAAARRARAQAEARHLERERIARDLHDTLLQANYALLLRLRTVRQAADGAVAQQLGDVLAEAVDTLNEGRDKVASLRAGAAAGGGHLGQRLRTVVYELVAGSRLEVDWRLRGHPWRLAPEVEDEIVTIASEAVRNVLKHADARTLRVEIAFDWLRLVLVIADDGCGIPAAYAGGRPGHWGLTGMAERARTIGARLVIDGGTGGTRVRLQAWRWRRRPGRAEGPP